MNTATKKRLSDASFPSWRMCQWRSSDQTFELTIATSDRTIDDLLQPGTFEDLRTTEFYGRKAIQYRAVADTHKMVCNLATPIDFGSIAFAVRNTRVPTDSGDPCADANRVGAALFNALP